MGYYEFCNCDVWRVSEFRTTGSVTAAAAIKVTAGNHTEDQFQATKPATPLQEIDLDNFITDRKRKRQRTEPVCQVKLKTPWRSQSLVKHQDVYGF